ncbi:hypothetical protein [Vibrio agarivorans]|nr:hypothetical protein [Vibrio agarivorans]MDN3661116.1 hypothetical protein [Vibrio agarivorans]
MTLVYFDGYSRIRLHRPNSTYAQLANIAAGFPPSYIWHIE